MAAIKHDEDGLEVMVMWPDEYDALIADRDKILEEIEAWKLASGLERGGDPDGVTPQDFEDDLLRRQACLYSAESQIAADNEACACGCPTEDHESYEEGISCEHDDHECLTTCVAIAGMLKKLRDERDALAVEVGRLTAGLGNLAGDCLIGTTDLRCQCMPCAARALLEKGGGA